MAYFPFFLPRATKFDTSEFKDSLMKYCKDYGVRFVKMFECVQCHAKQDSIHGRQTLCGHICCSDCAGFIKNYCSECYGSRSQEYFITEETTDNIMRMAQIKIITFDDISEFIEYLSFQHMEITLTSF